MMLIRSVSPKHLRFASCPYLLLCLIFPLTVAAEIPNAKEVADLRELQLEVRSLRDDVRRLSELLEKQLTTQPPHVADAKTAEATKSAALPINHLPPEIQVALQEKVTIDFKNAPLNRVIREICRMAKVSCIVDQHALSAEGVDATELISIEVSEVSAKSALNLILRPRNLTFLAEDEVLKITSIRRANGAHRVPSVVYYYNLYPHSSVLPSQDGLFSPFWQEIGRMMGLKDEPANGSDPKLAEPQDPAADSGASVPENQTKPIEPPRQTPSRSDGELEQALLKSVSLNFNDTSLIDVLWEIKRLANVNIVLDEAGLAEVGVHNDDRISIQVNEVSTRSALISLLTPINLSLMVDDEVLKITSCERAKGQLLSRTYSVGDLITPSVEKVIKRTGAATSSRSDYEEFYLKRLRRFVTKSVSPNHWEDVGGRGSIDGFPSTLSLVIRQTADVHDEIAKRLEELRRKRGRLPVVDQKPVSHLESR